MALKSRILTPRRGTRGRRVRPHKLVMLLAVLDLFDSGLLMENRIPLNDELIGRFRVQDELCQPGPPFFHLRTSGFWHHHVLPEHIPEYRSLTTTGSGTGTIHRLIEYAYLSNGTYRVFIDPDTRLKLEVSSRSCSKVRVKAHEDCACWDRIS